MTSFHIPFGTTGLFHHVFDVFLTPTSTHNATEHSVSFPWGSYKKLRIYFSLKLILF